VGGTAVNAQFASVDYADIQGIVRFAHAHLTDASYLLLKVADPHAARAWLRDAPVTNAVGSSPLPANALQLGFSAPGLRALGVPHSVLTQFSLEFLSGIAGDADRSRRLGDVGANSPQNWTWGTVDRAPHLVAALFAAAGTLERFAATLRTDAFERAFDRIAELDTFNLDGVEQFGFTDGISQPEVDWQRQRRLRGDKPSYSNVVSLGEFLLGYPNEYDRYTERPLLNPGGINDLLPAAEDDPSKRDLGRNGTYLVLRDLRQDVRQFWSFAKTTELASAFVGRRQNGDPLVPVAETSQNLFTYDSDPQGVRCPFGAHIRRANPRNGDFPRAPSGPVGTALAMLGLQKAGFHDDLTSSVRFHRILRRGREYGPKLEPAQATLPAPADDPPRGLRFVGLGANISRQFEFLQNAWLASADFNGLIGESDPILGNREPGPHGLPTDAFVMNRANAARTCVNAVPQFVTVTGGAYFFLPSLRALQYFSRAGEEETP